MDGIHDLGGRQGFGSVDAPPSEPTFHHAWERRAFGVTMATFAMGLSNGGQFRHSIERMHPVHYLTSAYYEHWITGVATRLVEEGLATVAELEQRAGGRFPLSQPEAHSGVTTPAPQNRAFAVGDRVLVARAPTSGHTRCPAYVRGHRGTVVRADPPAPLPDLEAQQAQGRHEPQYAVRFDARDLWGPASEPAAVHVDLWQSYLEPA